IPTERAISAPFGSSDTPKSDAIWTGRTAMTAPRTAATAALSTRNELAFMSFPSVAPLRRTLMVLPPSSRRARHLDCPLRGRRLALSGTGLAVRRHGKGARRRVRERGARVRRGERDARLRLAAALLRRTAGRARSDREHAARASRSVDRRPPRRRRGVGRAR